MILFLHNRYRVAGGEERTVEDLMWLVRAHLGEQAELLSRDSASVRRTQAAMALLRGGERPADVAAAVRRSGARVLHAHNLNPLLGWRALQAARDAGARVVLHLHQYRLVCAVGVCYTQGERCTRCHARNTMPGLVRGCRGSRAEAVSYAASLALWQSRVAGLADAVVVPSAFARERLRELGAPLDFDGVRVLPPPIRALGAPGARPVAPGAGSVAPGAESEAPGAPGAGSVAPGARPVAPGARPVAPTAPTRDRYALLAARLAPEKGVDVAIEACVATGRRLLVAGDGPERERLQRLARQAPEGQIELLGAVSQPHLARLRAGAALALAPSRFEETFGLAVAEAMAAGLPVIASDLGAPTELLAPDALVPAGDARALADRIEAMWADEQAGARNRVRIGELCAPEAVAAKLAEVYDGPAAA
jgi:glycosyltransferase involved in cell wall biosynthesis